MKAILIILALIISSITNLKCQTRYEIEFAQSIISNTTDTISSLESVKRLEDIIYYTHQGDYNYIIDSLNDFHIKYPYDSALIGCSIFSAHGQNKSLYLGRNFDNPEVGILIGHYKPTNGYSSICVTRIDDIGYDKYIDLDKMSLKEKSGILKSPFYICDGINEMGLSVAVAWVPSQKINPENNKKKILISLFLRKLIDNAKNVNEAISIANNYDVFDKNINCISHHFIIADKNGQSVIIEYKDGKMQFLKNHDPFQIITNSYIKDIPEDKKQSECWRYKILSNELELEQGIVDLKSSFKLLEKVSGFNNETNYGTQWSVVYDLNQQTGYLTAYRKFDKIYIFKIKK